jgi:signal transduction histidine kinase
MLSFFAITGLTNGIIGTFLSLFVYLRNKKDAANKSFARFCVAVSVWSYCYFFWQISTTESQALFWARGLMMGSIFIPVTLFHFGISFLDIQKKERNKLIIGYILSLIFFISNFTPLFVNRVEPVLSFNFWPKPGIIFHFFHLAFLFFMVYFWWLLGKAYQKSEGIRKTQVGFVLVGSLIGFISGETNHFLWYNIPTPPYWNFIPGLGFILIAYGVLKYRLLNIRTILTEILVGATAITLFIQASTAETLLLKVLGFLLFILFLGFGYTLVRSVIKEMELRAELEVAYGKLKELDDAKSEFISIASHQLRTPLTAVKGYISMILENSYGEVPGEMKRPIENIYTSNERLIKLVNDILNISKIEAGKIEISLERASLKDLILDVINELKIKADAKKLYLKFEEPTPSTSSGQAEPIPDTMFDKMKIRQIVMNLIDNAIKYTPQGGITVRLRRTDSNLRVEIQDTGIGLEKEDMAKLFKTFSRARAGAKAAVEGAGLGLYIARKFMDMHGGQIWVESPGKDKGSTFFIELPIK